MSSTPDFDHQPSSSQVTQEWRDGVVVITCAGEFDMLTAPELERHVDSALQRWPAAIIIDLRAVTFLASAGINILIRTRHRLSPIAGFAVVADGPATARPMSLIGLAGPLSLCGTLDEAYQRATAPARHAS